MCGITGIFAFTEEGKKYLDKIGDAVNSLRHRGPDGNGIFRHEAAALGHTRLAIIDTSDAAAQPFTSDDGRYTIVFNGEIFNYKELRAELEKEGHVFRSQSDTEVLLTLYAKEGEACLKKLNGFFAFAIYDSDERSLVMARDRFGEKPLYYYHSDDVLIFGSELKALLATGIPAELEPDAVSDYLHLNYFTDSMRAIVNVHIVEPGMIFEARATRQFSAHAWYYLGLKRPEKIPSYAEAAEQLKKLTDNAVQRRMIADVPVGTFLSGGVDSSIVTALAVRHHPQIQSFSIGFPDEPYFDETLHAEKVAAHLGTKHHVFPVTNKDLLHSLHRFLENVDEPFADSSALAVNLLAEQTRKYVTVALSGDGADELFAGYNKHAAELAIRAKSTVNALIKGSASLWEILPASRNSSFGNRVRQLRKYARGQSLSVRERYWSWAGFTDTADLQRLYRHYNPANEQPAQFRLHDESDFNAVLLNDVQMVLEGDMLVKVDRMSMLNGLEVRSPFLDHELVEFVMALPSEYKINRHERKRILKDAFRDLLPAEIFTRRKQGFEVPLLKWFRGELRGMIDELLDEKFLKEQNLFNPEEVQAIRKQLHSSDPGDAAARIWGLIVFQSWWRKYMR
jgi:asparagine synthase (glutamine-hydrolysing)